MRHRAVGALLMLAIVVAGCSSSKSNKSEGSGGGSSSSWSRPRGPRGPRARPGSQEEYTRQRRTAMRDA